jgi:hypothetical protein
VKETKPKLTHGGRRRGAGRPRTETVAKTYKLDPEIIARIKLMAKEQDRTESAIVNELLYKAKKLRMKIKLKAKVLAIKQPASNESLFAVTLDCGQPFKTFTAPKIAPQLVHCIT